MNKRKIINWLKFKPFYFGLSLLLIVISVFSLATNKLIIGLEFRGGSELTVSSEKELSTSEISELIEGQEIELSSIQSSGENRYILKLSQITEVQKNELLNSIRKFDQSIEEISFQTVGPSIGPELIRKTFYAIAIAAGAILLWVAIQFKSIKFGVSAILAMLHDSFILIGSFSLLGVIYGAEVDFLFVTAVLTTLSFSVHDTIVVFDRIREIQNSNSDITEISNKAVTETMRRSIINSLTIIFMLLSLVILGGVTIRWFATALLIGAVLGTYSSPFVAVPILETWIKRSNK